MKKIPLYTVGFKSPKAFGSIYWFSRLIVLILLAYNTVCCRKLVEDNFPDFPSIPVINSILIADSLLKVHVSFTDKIGNSKLAGIENALVIVASGSRENDTLTSIGNSIYQAKTVVQPLETYTLQVTIPGYETIVCSNTIPDTPEILAIQSINYAGIDEEGNTYPALKVTFKNKPDEALYFQIAIKLIQYDTVTFAQLIHITDPVLLHEGVPIPVFSNELIKTDSYTMLLNYTSGSQNNLDPLLVELRAISYDYYLYLKQLYLYETGRYPTEVGTGAVTNFNLYSNIEDGYGIFAGYSLVVSDTVQPETYYY